MNKIRYVTRAATIVITGAMLVLTLAACGEGDERTGPPEDDTVTGTRSDTSDAAGAARDDASASQGSVLMVLQQDQRFSRFADALGQAGLADVLDGDGPFTVFAPVNEAFDGADTADDDELRDLVMNHISADMRMQMNEDEISTVQTLYGDDLALLKATNGEVRVEDALVVDADIDATNGIIHAIDGVLRPAETEDAGSM